MSSVNRCGKGGTEADALAVRLSRIFTQEVKAQRTPRHGFRQNGAATTMSAAIASVQSGYGNTAPMQIELEPSVTTEEEGVELVMALIEDHFAQGGTLIHLNVIDRILDKQIS